MKTLSQLLANQYIPCHISIESEVRYMEQDKNYDDELVGTCLKCGIEIRSIKGKKKKRFCSDRCRWDWWNNHIKEEKLKSQLEANQQNHNVSK
jgi:endogenous inhibitor of DNA gyrase (YacG/DUF329 family)